MVGECAVPVQMWRGRAQSRCRCGAFGSQADSSCAGRCAPHSTVRGIDIGTGASCIYPMLGSAGRPPTAHPPHSARAFKAACVRACVRGDGARGMRGPSRARLMRAERGASSTAVVPCRTLQRRAPLFVCCAARADVHAGVRCIRSGASSPRTFKVSAQRRLEQMCPTPLPPARSHSRAHAHTLNAHAQTHKQTHADTHTHARAHTRTNTHARTRAGRFAPTRSGWLRCTAFRAYAGPCTRVAAQCGLSIRRRRGYWQSW